MEIRIKNDQVEVTGYVNAVGRESHPLQDRDGYFTETIMPGAFAAALRDNPNVPMFLNHDADRVIASGDDLDLREDNVGLHVRATIKDPEVISKASEQRLSGWSFGFVPLDQSYEDREGNLRHRRVNRMSLHEVSLLDDTKRPAYLATSVYTRDGEGADAVELRFMDDAIYFRDDSAPDPPDLTQYEKILDELGVIE